jgi:hypothetical protein
MQVFQSLPAANAQGDPTYNKLGQSLVLHSAVPVCTIHTVWTSESTTWVHENEKQPICASGAVVNGHF